VANGIVYMGATDIFAFDAVTGDRLWAYPLNSDVNTSPAIADGVLFVGDFDNRFWAFALRDRAAR
jgi:outer membrane protein assembly factor BamB